VYDIKDLKIRQDKMDILSMVLFNISYIIKHFGFKEEQECRFFTSQKLRDARNILFCAQSRRMYIELDLPIEEGLKLITFAPNATEYQLFMDRLEQIDNLREGEDRARNKIKCVQSKMRIN
jgi:hypothetical protein